MVYLDKATFEEDCGDWDVLCGFLRLPEPDLTRAYPFLILASGIPDVIVVHEHCVDFL